MHQTAATKKTQLTKRIAKLVLQYHWPCSSLQNMTEGQKSTWKKQVILNKCLSLNVTYLNALT